MHSGGAAICVSVLCLAVVAECFVNRSVHAYAHVQAPKTLICFTVPLTHAACVRECRTVGTQKAQ